MSPELLLYCILSILILSQKAQSEGNGYRQELWPVLDDDEQRPSQFSDSWDYDSRLKRWASQLRFGKRASWASKVRFG